MTEWSAAKFHAFIVGTLRSGFRRFPNKYEVLKEAFVGKKLNEKTNRVGMHYRCAHCLGEFPAKDVNIDHIEAAVDPAVGFVNWDTFIERLFCPKENLQCLCNKCHDQKSSEERKIRNDTKQKNKKA